MEERNGRGVKSNFIDEVLHMHLSLLHCVVPAAIAAGLVILSVAANADGAAAPAPSASGIIVKPGQKLAFLGASISQFGWTHPGGYIRLTVDALAADGNAVVALPEGVSGNTSRDMLARLDRDVISKRPDWVTIDAGGNDVWHGTVSFAEYMTNMTEIVDKAQAAGIHVIIQTCTPIGEDLDGDFDKKLAYYNDFLRYLASSKRCVLADLNADSVRVLKTKTQPGNLLTVDGVHMNDIGNRLMASGLLKALGMSPADVARLIPGDIP